MQKYRVIQRSHYYQGGYSVLAIFQFKYEAQEWMDKYYRRENTVFIMGEKEFIEWEYKMKEMA